MRWKYLGVALRQRKLKKTYQGKMRAVQHCQTVWHIELRGPATLTRAECANHSIVVDGSKTHHLIAIPVQHEDFARRRHNGDSKRIGQRAGGSRQLSNPGAIRRPQHCHTMVAIIHHEEEGLVGCQCQVTRVLELAGFIASRSDSALPLTLYLM